MSEAGYMAESHYGDTMPYEGWQNVMTLHAQWYDVLTLFQGIRAIMSTLKMSAPIMPTPKKVYSHLVYWAKMFNYPLVSNSDYPKLYLWYRNICWHKKKPEISPDCVFEAQPWTEMNCKLSGVLLTQNQGFQQVLT